MRSPRLGVKALIVREGQVLMNRYLEPDGREVFALPGGGHVLAAVNATALATGDRVTLGVRPEHLFHAGVDTDQAISGTVEVVEDIHSAKWMKLVVNAAELISNTPL